MKAAIETARPGQRVPKTHSQEAAYRQLEVVVSFVSQSRPSTARACRRSLGEVFFGVAAKVQLSSGGEASGQIHLAIAIFRQISAPPWLTRRPYPP